MEGGWDVLIGDFRFTGSLSGSIMINLMESDIKHMGLRVPEISLCSVSLNTSLSRSLDPPVSFHFPQFSATQYRDMLHSVGKHLESVISGLGGMKQQNAQFHY